MPAYAYCNDIGYKVDAQTGGQELERIEKIYGIAKPEYIVEESRPKDAVLHPVFEWNDQVAAEKYRIVQARDYTRHIIVITSETNKPVRAFVNIKVQHPDNDDKETRGYINIITVMNNKTYRDQLLEQSRKDLRAFRNKYEILEEYRDFFEVIDGMGLGEKED